MQLAGMETHRIAERDRATVFGALRVECFAKSGTVRIEQVAIVAWPRPELQIGRSIVHQDFDALRGGKRENRGICPKDIHTSWHWVAHDAGMRRCRRTTRRDLAGRFRACDGTRFTSRCAPP